MDYERYGAQAGDRLSRIGDQAASFYLMFDRNRREKAQQDYDMSFRERAWQMDSAKRQAENDLQEVTARNTIQDIQTQRSAMPYLSNFQKSLGEAKSQALISGDPTPIRNLQIPQEILDTRNNEIIGAAYAQRYDALNAAEAFASNSTFEAQFRNLKTAVKKYSDQDSSFGTDAIGLMSDVNKIEAEAKQNFLQTGTYSISDPSRARLQEIGQFMNMRLGDKELRDSTKSSLPKMYDASLQEAKTRSYAYNNAAEQQVKIYDSQDKLLQDEMDGYQRQKNTLLNSFSTTQNTSNKQAIQQKLDENESLIRDVMARRQKLNDERKEFLGAYQQGVGALDNMASAASQSIPSSFKEVYKRDVDTPQEGAKNSALVFNSGGRGAKKKFKDESKIKQAIQEGKYTVEEALKKIEAAGAEASPDLMDFLYRKKQGRF